MTREGIKVISYYIDGKEDGYGVDCFRRMYGKESQFINVNRNGQGKYFWSNGDKYEGEFKGEKLPMARDA